MPRARRLSTGDGSPARQHRHHRRVTATTLFLALAALLATAGAARADWAYARWGMTMEAVIRASHGAVRALPAEHRRAVPGAGMEWRAEGTHAEGALRLRVAFAFDTRSGGLVCVNYAVADARQNAALRDWLVARHGRPQSGDPQAPLDGSDLSWRGGGRGRGDEIDASFDRGVPAEVLHCRRR